MATVKVLVVPGGGGGGAWVGGGGAAGLPVFDGEYEITDAEITVTVGDGGLGGAYPGANVGQNGEDSSFDALVAPGGGGGGSYGNPDGSTGDGVDGGCGGGGGGKTSGTSYGGSGDTGKDGGDSTANTSPWSSAGGGGASESGSNNAGSGVGGKGGDGTDAFSELLAALGLGIDISGTHWIAGGGGGSGDNTGGSGGKGGGGTGGTFSGGTDGAANTGSGGGGLRDAAGKNGGSGLVIVYYPVDGSTGVYMSSLGGNRVIVSLGGVLHVTHTFLSSGTFTPAYSMGDVVSWDDDFTGSDNDPINSDRWFIVGSPDIQNNTAELTNDEQLILNRLAEGDFEIEVDFELQSPPSTNGWNAGVDVRIDATHHMFIGPRYESGQKQFDSVYNIGVGDVYTRYYRGDTEYGKLKIVRVGSNMSTYAAIGGGGYSLCDEDIAVGSGDCTVSLLINRWSFNPDLTCRFDNFAIDDAVVREAGASGPMVWIF